ncbi:hypothetical protein Dimus_003065, partial [Dionaea muscipula]
THGRARPRKAARMHLVTPTCTESMNISCSCPHDECTLNAAARPTPSAAMPPPAGVLLADGCSAMRRETRSPFARRRGSLLLARRTATARRRFAMQGGSELVGEGCTFGTRQLHTPTRRAPGCSPGRRLARRPLAWRERGSACTLLAGEEGARRARRSRACMKPAARRRAAARSPASPCITIGARSSPQIVSLLKLLAARRPDARLLAGFRARCSPARRLLIVLMLVTARGHHHHQAVRSSPASRP